LELFFFQSLRNEFSRGRVSGILYDMGILQFKTATFEDEVKLKVEAEAELRVEEYMEVLWELRH
jgi:hypothetical protein